MVGVGGLEPPRIYIPWILSPIWLPITAHPQEWLPYSQDIIIYIIA